MICFKRPRTAVLIALAYVGVTVFAASFQEAGLTTVLRDWLSNPGLGHLGESNLQAWLSSLGLKQWSLPAAMVVLAAFGLWTYRHRHVDLWLLIGVSALVARFWTYHRWYDDLLILLPVMTLFRIAKEAPSDGTKVLAGALFAATLLAMLAPGGLYLFPHPWNTLYIAGQVVVWCAVLIFLLHRARRENYAAAKSAQPILATP
jgi:hypothetical protein